MLDRVKACRRRQRDKQPAVAVASGVGFYTGEGIHQLHTTNGGIGDAAEHFIHKIGALARGDVSSSQR